MVRGGRLRLKQRFLDQPGIVRHGDGSAGQAIAPASWTWSRLSLPIQRVVGVGRRLVESVAV